MYLTNGRLSQSPKWLYIIVPTLFFAFTGLNFFVAQFLDTTGLIQQEISPKRRITILI